MFVNIFLQGHGNHRRGCKLFHSFVRDISLMIRIMCEEVGDCEVLDCKVKLFDLIYFTIK